MSGVPMWGGHCSGRLWTQMIPDQTTPRLSGVPWRRPWGPWVTGVPCDTQERVPTPEPPFLCSVQPWELSLSWDTPPSLRS